MALGFALIVFGSGSLFVLGLGVLILGFGYGSTVPVIFDTASKISKGAAASTATALLVSSIYAGQFISPVVLGSVSRIFGDGSVSFSYTMMTFALIFVAAILLAERFLHFTGMKRYLKRDSSKRLFTEISSQQSELNDTVRSLSKQFEQTVSDRDQNLMTKLEELTTDIKTINSRLDKLSEGQQKS